MIKNSIIKHNFTPTINYATLVGTFPVTGYGNFTGGVYSSAIGHTTFVGGGHNNTTIGYTAGYAMTVNQGSAATAQFTLTNDGNANFSGRVTSLGSVMYNSELNRLEAWNGTSWMPITI